MTGIQRVVRNIVKTMPLIAPEDIEIIPVIWTGIRFIPLTSDIQPTNIFSKLSRTKKIASPVLSSFTVILRLYIRKSVRFFIASFLTFRYIIHPSIFVRKNDIWLFPDASWHLSSPLYWKFLSKVKSKGGKIGFLFHDIIPILYPQYCEEEFRVEFEIWFYKAFSKLDFFITVSETVGAEISDLIQKKGLYLPPHTYNHSGMSLDFISKNPKESVRMKSIFSKRPTFIYVSTVEIRKNHEYALNAFSELWKRECDVSFLIIGKKGWLCDVTIKNILTHPEFNKRLFWINDAPDDELRYAYTKAEALIFTSYCEGFGLPIIEGFSFGIPVIASNIPVHREIGGTYASYVDLKDPESLVENIVGKKYKSTPLPKNFEWQKWEESSRSLLTKMIDLATHISS